MCKKKQRKLNKLKFKSIVSNLDLQLKEAAYGKSVGFTLVLNGGAMSDNTILISNMPEENLPNVVNIVMESIDNPKTIGVNAEDSLKNNEAD